jgi:hypothetical protein
MKPVDKILGAVLILCIIFIFILIVHSQVTGNPLRPEFSVFVSLLTGIVGYFTGSRGKK